MAQKSLAYYYLDELQLGHGPVDATAIANMLRSGNLMVWRAGLPDWTKATALPEFAHLRPPPPHASLAELLQLGRHVLEDGTVTAAEAAQIKDWIAGHPEVIDHWPGNVLATRLSEIYRDGIITDAERTELRDLLHYLTHRQPRAADVAAQLDKLPIDQPPPVVHFPQKHFCLAGRMVFGSVDRCFAALRQRQAHLHLHPQWDTHYVVIGGLQPDQKLIAQAVKLKKLGAALHIITEEHWANALA